MKKKDVKSVNVQVKMTKRMHELLEEIAYREDRSVSYIIRRAVEAYCAKKMTGDFAVEEPTDCDDRPQ